MNVLAQTGQVEAHEAQVTIPVTPSVTGQPESRPEWKPDWFSKGVRTFLSAKQSGKKERRLYSPHSASSGLRRTGRLVVCSVRQKDIFIKSLFMTRYMHKYLLYRQNLR